MIKNALGIVLAGVFFFCTSAVFSLTPKELKGVKTLIAPTIEYASPSWFTPFALQDAPEDLGYRLSLLSEQERSGEMYIVLPTLGLISPVILVPSDSTDYTTMQGGGEIDINKYLVDGVLHYPGTPLPDQEGNIVIFGHSNFYKEKPGRYKTIFADIMQLDVLPTDEIWLYRKQPSGKYELYKYQVEQSYDTVPTDVALLQPTGGKELTVFACTNGLAGRWILRARQLPDGEILVPSRMKVRVWELMHRFAKLSPEVQEQIRERFLTALESTYNDIPTQTLTMTQKMRKYLLKRLETMLVDENQNN